MEDGWPVAALLSNVEGHDRILGIRRHFRLVPDTMAGSLPAI
jgi:hypothetical protein